MTLLDKVQAITNLTKDEILKKFCVEDFGIKTNSTRRCRQSECKQCWDKFEIEQEWE